MPKRTRKRARPTPAPVVVREEDQTVLDLGELAVLWPRLEAAMARDVAGPSAEHGRHGNGGGEGSPSVINLDVERARAAIITGVDKVSAEAEALLNLDRHWRPSVRRLQAASVLFNEATHAHLANSAALAKLQQLAELAEDDEPPSKQLVDAEAAYRESGNLVRRRGGIVITAKANAKRMWTTDVINALPDWYVQLRNRNQPLAGHIKADASKWLRQARGALRLVSGDVGLGRLCPDHRNCPTELRRVPDEAQLPASVLDGRTQPIDSTTGLPIEAALTWRRSEAVRCPKCNRQWTGVSELRVLMRMIDAADKPPPSPTEEDLVTKPTNTSELPAEAHLAGMLTDQTEYITGMEAAGQGEIVRSTVLPIKGPWSALAELGFVAGEIADDLFRHVTLPEGWTREASDHNMWSYIADQHGARRVAVFYKAAFYDRRADMHLCSEEG